MLQQPRAACSPAPGAMAILLARCMVFTPTKENRGTGKQELKFSQCWDRE